MKRSASKASSSQSAVVTAPVVVGSELTKAPLVVDLPAVVNTVAPKAKRTKKASVPIPTPTTDSITMSSSSSLPISQLESSGKQLDLSSSVDESAVSISFEPLDAEVSNPENVNELDLKCAELYSKLQDFATKASAIRSDFKLIEKIWSKKMKAATKNVGKKKKKIGNRAPSGFVKPTRISEELALFLGKPSGSEMARTEVTREINVYIRANQLQDATNGRKINANPALATLLHLSPEDELTYFNLQKYMSVHFPKAVVVVVPPAVVDTPMEV